MAEALSLSSSSSKPLFVLFTGAKVESTGQSWCPDCVAAEPIIMEELSKISEGCVLLECLVVRDEYRQPSYQYRTDNSIKLKCVPTLHRFSNEGKSIVSLNDSQCQVADLVRELVLTDA